MQKDVCGVYRIINTVNGKCYVGSSKVMRERWAQHSADLGRQDHGNKHLQNAWNCYGSASFKFEILELVDDVKRLCEVEQYWMDYYQVVPNGYNIRPVAECTRGYRHTEEHKAYISALQTGRPGKPLSAESRAKISRAKRGIPVAEETKKKMSEAVKGRIKSDEHRRKIAETLAGRNKGVPRSEEDKQRMRDGWAKRRAQQSIS